MKPDQLQKLSLIFVVLALAVSACSPSGSKSPTSTTAPAIASTDTPAATSAAAPAAITTATPAAYPAPAGKATPTPTIPSTDTPAAYPAPASKATSAPTLAPTATLVPTEAPHPSSTTTMPPTPVPQPTTAITTTMGSANAKAALLAAFFKLQTAYPFRLTETGNLISGNGTDSTRVNDYAAADQYHSVITSTTEVDEEIVIGTKVYARVNGGTWMAATQSSGRSAAQLGAQLAASLTDVQFLDNEKLNGVDTMSYSFTATAGGSNGTGKVWVGAADGLPYRIELSTPFNGITLSGTLVYQYGVKVTIKAPIP